MMIVDRITARGTFLRGFLVSSASGAAASKPEKASSAPTAPAITPVMPLYPCALAALGVKTDSVLLPPAFTTRTIDRLRNTMISMKPSTTPVRVDVLTPR